VKRGGKKTLTEDNKKEGTEDQGSKKLSAHKKIETET
jgi:hypothetical protein